MRTTFAFFRSVATAAVLATSLASTAFAQSSPSARSPSTAAPSVTRLRFLAPRGNDGKPPPVGDDGWTQFLGAPSHDLTQHWNDARNHVPVHQPGVVAPRASTSSVAKQLVSRGVQNATIAGRAAQNVALGLPSNATTASRSDYLIARKDSVISYNYGLRGPNWVAWRTAPENLGEHPFRSDDHWRADPSLPRDAVPATFHDYEHSGFDPGHMLRSGERTSTARANQRTYVLSNTLPQAFNNNRGPWLGFENHYLHMVQNNGVEVHVIAGGTFGREPVRIGSGVAVPNATWKIVVATPVGHAIDKNAKVMAVIIPNSDTEIAKTDDFRKFATTPAHIEQLTGLRFFTELPRDVATALRKRGNDFGPEAAAPQH